MRLRIKFCKTGELKYIGHLDVMRYFQKVLRRARLNVAFSWGFHPHMIMSFALPLGVGVTSTGEYFDVDMAENPAPLGTAGSGGLYPREPGERMSRGGGTEPRDHVEQRIVPAEPYPREPGERMSRGGGTESHDTHEHGTVNAEEDPLGLTERLNRYTDPDLRVLNVVPVSDRKEDKCMTIVRAADYTVRFAEVPGAARFMQAADTAAHYAGSSGGALSRPGNSNDSADQRAHTGEMPGTAEMFADFMQMPKITVIKKTKNGERETDIRPLILDYKVRDRGTVWMRLCAGSVSHLNPQLLIDAFCRFVGLEDMACSVHREEMYTVLDGRYFPLDAPDICGVDFRSQPFAKNHILVHVQC